MFEPNVQKDGKELRAPIGQIDNIHTLYPINCFENH